jgi:hypothetical protein
VFIASQQQLVKADTDDLYDLYDVRVGGGLPDPELAKPGCLGDGCQPPPGSDPSLLLPVSPFLGPVSGDDGERVKGKVARFAIPRSAISARLVTLRVRAPGAGRLRASGRGLKAARRTASRSAVYTLKLRLGASAKARLRSKGRLSVSVRVRFTPKAGKTVAKSVRLTIKRKTRANRKAR